MNEKNEMVGENLADIPADTGRNFLFRAKKVDFERRFPLNAIPPMRHWTFGEDSKCDIREGDTAWVTVFSNTRPFLVAPFCVGRIVGNDEANAICGTPFEFPVPAEYLTHAYCKCLRKRLPPHSDLAVNSTGGILLKMSYEPFEIPNHMFAAGNCQDWEFPKFLDISDWAASNNISSRGQWSWKRLKTPDSAAQLRDIWQSAKPGFQCIPEGISWSKMEEKPAFTIV